MNYATKMLRTVGAAAVAALFVASMPAAHAVEQTWNFNGTLNDAAFSGSFSFDDAVLSAVEGFDGTYAPVTSFSMSYLGASYSLADVWEGYAEVSFYNDAFLGLLTSVDPMTFIADPWDGAYVTDGFASADVIYAPVPEPQSYAMLLAGLGLLGFASRRWVK